MQLTRKQKRQVKKLAKVKSPEEIADILKLEKQAVIDFLPQPRLVSKLNNFPFRSWLKQNYLFLILLAVLGFVSYLNGLNNEFLSDDIATIRDNPEITTWQFAFSHPFIFLRGFLYFVTANLFGKSPAAFRFPNILFHIGCSWLFYFLICKTVSKKVAIFASSIFVVHPLLSEAITWISGGYYPMYGFFVLLSLVFYSFSKKNDRFYYYSLIAFIFALFTSERVVYFPGILLFWEFCFGDLKKNWKKSLPFFGLSLIWGLFFISGRIGERINELQTSYYQKKTIQNPFFQIPVALSSYFWLMLWPKALTLYHSEMNFSKINFTARFVVTSGYFLSLLYALKKNKTIFFWLSFFFITLTPFLTPLGISWVVAERYVYLGSMGIFVSLGILLEKLLKKEKQKYLFYLITALLVIPLSVRTIYRNIDWKNQDNLWLAASRTSPSSPQNHNNLGDLYNRRGEFDKAAEEFKIAISLLPNYGDAYHNLANVYLQMGKIDLAIENYEKALSFNPGLWQSHQNLAAIYAQQNKVDLTVEHLQKAIEINPQDPRLRLNMGIIFLNLGKKEEAKKEFLYTLQLEPENADAQKFLQATN